MAVSREHAEHEFEEIQQQPAGSGAGRLELDDLRDMRLPVTAEVGRRRMTIREVLELRPGSVVRLEKLAGEMTDIHVSGIPLARGEVVVIGDTLHVRIGEVLGAEAKGDEGADDG